MNDEEMKQEQDVKPAHFYQSLSEAMDLDDMICRSICSFENHDLRRKLANSMLLVGGPAKHRFLVDVIEEKTMSKFMQFDDSIDRVEVIIYNLVQYQT